MLNIDLKALLRKLNRPCKESLEEAVRICMSHGNYEVAVDHMLLALVDDPARDFQVILRHFEIDPAYVRRDLQRTVEGFGSGNQGRPVFSPLLIQWIEAAWMIASVELRLGEIRSGVLIAALPSLGARYEPKGTPDRLTAIGYEELRGRFFEVVAGSTEVPEPATAPGGPVTAAGGASAGAAPTGLRTAETALGCFTSDFTALARAGRIDPVFCRDREIRQMVDILARRRKNNPIVVGEAGVGKTAVVEGLALKVVEGDVPDILANVDVLGLDLGLLQAGAGVKGEFESRLKAVIDEVKASPKPIVLFIDEAHTLIGAGGQAGMSDAANLLKPALARGELRTIAATTWSEYKKYFEKDAALARRFQLVRLEEPSPEEAVTIIRGLRETYERAHGVHVRDDAVEAMARLSARYLSGRQLPDKAVDVLDTASARIKIGISAKPDCIDARERHIQILERELAAIRRDIDAGTRAGDSLVADLERRIAADRAELAGETERWRRERELVGTVLARRRELAETTGGQAGGDRAAVRQALDRAIADLASVQGDAPLIDFEVTPKVVAQVIADWTGIPVGNMVKDEAQAILDFKANLSRRIKGQDQAVAMLDEGIRAARVGLRTPTTAPMGVFLLVGPSGVGKTETGLGIADLLFGGERFLITINMSEFQEKHTVSRLIGSPPGYVGYGEGGRLTEAVRQRPYSVILLDEVEKADLEVMNLFYQVFDKGTLSDGEGRPIDFRNTVILLTSNLGSDVISGMCAGGPMPRADEVVKAIRPILTDHFKPALLARMQIVPYFPIGQDAMAEIVELKLRKVGQQLMAAQRIGFSYKPEVVERIVQRCTEVETGARNVDYIINRTLLPQVSTEILEHVGSGTALDRLELGIGPDGNFAYGFRSSGTLQAADDPTAARG